VGAPFDVETSGTLEVNFEYDGTSAVVLAFGGYNTDVKIDNVMVATVSPGDNKWAGYDIIDGQFVDTGSLLGLLEITSAPWVYSYDLGRYIYLPESAVSQSGAWTFFPT
jgi:hypothetical protein